MPFNLIETTLPSGATEFVVGSPSRNRWGGNGKSITLVDTITSTATILNEDGFGKDAWLLISDASSPDNPDMSRPRAETIANLDLPQYFPPIYIATRQTRARVLEHMEKLTGANHEVVKAEVDGVGYGDNRETLDNLAAALSLASKRPVKFITIDDDVTLPLQPPSWRRSILEKEGIAPLPNSQVVYAFSCPEEQKEMIENDPQQNSIKAFVAPLGQTVAQLREKYPEMKIGEELIDTRPQAFERALNGEIAQFALSPDQQWEPPGLDEAIVIATTEDKSKLPDYPTWVISENALMHEYPGEEPVEAYPSGPRQFYAALRSNTIFPDSALFGRIFNANSDLDPAFWPWWHVSSRKISRRYGLAQSSFRADNDFLPKWLADIYDKTGKLYLYGSGIPTYALHSRTRFGGDRRAAAEASIASQVGNIVAVETFKRFEFPPSGVIYMHPIEADYQAPDEHAEIVFDRMHSLKDIAKRKIKELDFRQNKTTDPTETKKINNLLDRYIEDLTTLNSSMSFFNFGKWKKKLDSMIREQLDFSRQSLAIKPTIIFELGNMINRGEYPVLQVVKQ